MSSVTDLTAAMATLLVGRKVDEIFMAVANLVASTGTTIEPENPHRWIFEISRCAANIVDNKNDGKPMQIVRGAN